MADMTLQPVIEYKLSVVGKGRKRDSTLFE